METDVLDSIDAHAPRTKDDGEILNIEHRFCHSAHAGSRLRVGNGRTSLFNFGRQFMRPCVYACLASRRFLASSSSTTCPAYMTSTRSQKEETSLRSCEMKIRPIPRSDTSSSRMRSTSTWTVTSR